MTIQGEPKRYKNTGNGLVALVLSRLPMKEKVNEQDNTRLVRQAYQNLSAGNIQLFLNFLAEDVRWELPEMENVPFAGKWQGRGQVRRFFDKVFEAQEVIAFVPEEFVAQGDKVVVLGRFSMHIKATSRDFGSDWAHVWTIKGGRATRFYEYVDTAIVSKAYTAAQTAP